MVYYMMHPCGHGWIRRTAMLEFVKKLLGGGNDAALKKLKKTVDAVDAL